MIPVRVPADIQIPTSGGIRTLDPAHPLVDELCPACDEVLVGRPITLVVVGIAPADRARAGAFATGAAVAVHAVCALGAYYDRPAPLTSPQHELSAQELEELKEKFRNATRHARVEVLEPGPSVTIRNRAERKAWLDAVTAAAESDGPVPAHLDADVQRWRRMSAEARAFATDLVLGPYPGDDDQRGVDTRG